MKVNQRQNAELRHGLVRLIQRAAEATAADVDVEMVATGLFGLIDGLSLQYSLEAPAVTLPRSEEICLDYLRLHGVLVAKS